MMRRLAVAVLVALAVSASRGAIPIVTRFKSPKNAERPMRSATTLIVLHTTEAPAKSALRHPNEQAQAPWCANVNSSFHYSC